ncbi:helix-turn-helix domain-containing protein [Yinghuangia sp. ASG 101]|uniref:helix-turn-helix domain-containing protein n=1 Tax=Yinghuangia sp. ASG 101 TaxID=2896848 RepID=UPI001E33AD66|nr:helix-turn-helix domain-containing protein [Yinghuangia sp. ASG 101]UGQ12190.1 helix-turn-helix domain-containing protein [Yinghuangia sp. ASG 101]
MSRPPGTDAFGAIPSPAAGGRRHVVRPHGRTRPVLRPGPSCQGSDAAPDIDSWREILRDAVVELDASPVDLTPRTDYTGWVYLLDLGAVSVTDVASDPMHAARTRRLIDRNPVDFYHLMLARRPSHTVSDDRPNELRTGDAVLLDSTRQYSFTADSFAHYLSVNVPRAALIRDLRTTPELGRLIPAHDPTLRVLSSVVAELCRGSAVLPPDTLAELGHTTYELLVSTLRTAAAGDTRLSTPQLSRQAQLPRMRDFVLRHFTDPALTPQLIATAFGVSVRYVDLVFRAGDSSPSRYIRETRLAAARRMLADPRQAHRPIAAIARSVGITDPGVFARGFRRQYDITPSDYRAHTRETTT